MGSPSAGATPTRSASEGLSYPSLALRVSVIAAVPASRAEEWASRPFPAYPRAIRVTCHSGQTRFLVLTGGKNQKPSLTPEFLQLNYNTAPPTY